MRWGQLAFPMILERMHSRRFQIRSVTANSHRAGRIGRLAAAAHARMEAQSAFIQVRMRQCIHHVYPLLLQKYSKIKKIRKKKTKKKKPSQRLASSGAVTRVGL